MKLNVFLKITRINFIPASIIPFLVGAALAFRYDGFLLPSKFIFGIIAITSAHICGNLFNEYYDDKYGADKIKGMTSPFFGGSGLIQRGIVKAADVFILAVFFLFLAFLAGVSILIITRDPIFVLFMLITCILTIGYTAPPLRLAYNRMGEIDIFFLFGVFLVMGSFYLFHGAFDSSAFFASLPVAFLVSAVIICNEVPDVESDVACGKRNLVSFLGKSKAYILYFSVIVLSFVSLFFNVKKQIISFLSLFVIFLYPLGLASAYILKNKINEINALIKASGFTIALHAVVGISIIVGILTQ